MLLARPSKGYVGGFDAQTVLWYCWLGLLTLTCKNRRPYNLYCVGADVKPCSINPQTEQLRICLFVIITVLHFRSSLRWCWCLTWQCQVVSLPTAVPVRLQCMRYSSSTEWLCPCEFSRKSLRDCWTQPWNSWWPCGVRCAMLTPSCKQHRLCVNCSQVTGW